MNILQMPEQEFWQIINSTCARENCAKIQTSNLKKSLLQLGANEINAFDLSLSYLIHKSLSDKLWDAAEVILGGCGDDSFIDFRYWLVSKGKKIFEAALHNPDILAKYITDEDIRRGCSFPEFAAVGGEVWDNKTGKNYLDPKSGYQRFQQPIIQPTLEDMEYKFPKLSARFQTHEIDINTGDNEILEKLQSKSSKQRYSAVDILRQTKNRKLVAPILDLLSHTNAESKCSCIQALIELGDTNAIPKIIELVSNTKEDKDVRYVAANALGHIKSEIQEEVLCKLLKDEDWHVRSASATSLGLLGGKNSPRFLIEALTAKNDIVGLNAELGYDIVKADIVGALGNFNSGEVILALSKYGIKDKNDRVRGISAAALGHLNVKQALKDLISLLHDDSSFVRDKTVWALEQLKATSAISKIEQTIAKEPAGYEKKRMEKSLKNLKKLKQ